MGRGKLEKFASELQDTYFNGTQLNYDDGTNFIIKIPAEIWKMNRKQITKIFATKKQVSSFTLDPKLETADIDLLKQLVLYLL